MKQGLFLDVFLEFYDGRNLCNLDVHGFRGLWARCPPPCAGLCPPHFVSIACPFAVSLELICTAAQGDWGWGWVSHPSPCLCPVSLLRMSQWAGTDSTEQQQQGQNGLGLAMGLMDLGQLYNNTDPSPDLTFQNVSGYWAKRRNHEVSVTPLPTKV